MRRIRQLLIPVATLLLIAPAPVTAQLLSPGRLAAPHSELEGVRNCTKCHVLGERGISNRLCLDCHIPIRNRLVRGRGYHSTVADQPCSNCHKDHFGEEFQLVRFDTASFRHSSVGFELVETHQSLDCTDCHQPELIVATDVRSFKAEHGALGKTLLGLGMACTDCHAVDDPHDGQFSARTCTECHGQTIWTELRGFDHRRTRFALTGRHRQLSCGSCHPTTLSAPNTQVTRYTNMRFSRCSSCHDDVHSGSMGSDCTTCHNTTGWSVVDRTALETRFDHEITGYPLLGAHARLTCTQCHDLSLTPREGIDIAYAAGTIENAYPTPTADTCLSCHVDFHGGVFEESQSGRECEICHSQDGWLPTSFDITRHNREARFPLSGAHVVTPCMSCHNTPQPNGSELRFRFESYQCSDCHSTENPHSTQFAGRECVECHDTDSFVIPAFDHTNTNYPLDGAHRDVPCESCHHLRMGQNGREFRIYRPLGTECRDCHGGYR